ncbi:hypothetical protein BVX98_03205 [bacterium F11]|nr:hypothetical protein BVX98_03205 [bacterium F11]
MIRINLLPPEYAAAQAKKEQQIIFGSIGAILFIVLFGFLGIQKQKAASLQKDISEAQADLNKFKAINAQIETIQKSKRQLLAKRDVIKNLNRSRLTYPVLFEDLLPIIPSDVWVNSINLKEKGSQITLDMRTKALSNFALATWLTNLEESKHFSNIDLGGINYSRREEGSATLNFNISCNYRHQGALPLENVY